ncbi:MAG: hypothetical protein ACJ8NS_08775 [Chthoniobacterales bacterium]
MTSDHFSTDSQLCCGSGLQSEQMKLKPTLFLALMCTAQLAPNVFAQSPPDRPERPFRQFLTERRAARLANLNEDERARLRAAYQKALQDPAVQTAREKMKQARREFREVMRPALLKADPSVQPILEKLRAERQEKADRQ